MVGETISFIRKTFGQPDDFIPLHAPHFGGNEKKYVLETIESTFVSSVGAYVTRFEEMMCEITGAKYAIATVNGTTALHLALVLAGVKRDELVITQPLTFVATANAITHAGGLPVFVDVDRDTLGLSPSALKKFLEEESYSKEGQCFHQQTNKRIAAVLPMHTFGLPCRIDEIADICRHYGITLVEDAAESLGSYYKGVHTGNFGAIGTFSFNGNKTVTCGGGGAIITNDETIAKAGKHLSTTAKVPHPWAFFHDEVGYNYRMPNLNAALACAQLEQLPKFIENKRELAALYKTFFETQGITFISEIVQAQSNYWLNAILLKDIEARDHFLAATNQASVMTRPIWTLMNKLPMYKDCICANIDNAEWLEERVVNLPSSVRVRHE
jgi:perosamine synthetase